jgi:hypothetical protein
MATWKPLKNQPGFNADTMLLLTDGTVMCHEFNSANWHKLAPDVNGNYENGTWSNLKGLPNDTIIPAASGGPVNAPLYFASAVLANGKVLTAGGEYNTGVANADTLAVQIYDPPNDAWTPLAAPSGWTGIGDGVSCLLADGRLLLGSYNSASAAIFDPSRNKWIATSAKGDACSEETFTLLPDGSVLTVQCSNVPNAEKYIPATDKWVSAGSTKATLPQACAGLGAEIGPAILLPDGRVFAIGATGNTGLYTPPPTSLGSASPGTWASGPTLTDSNAVFDHSTQHVVAISRAPGNLDLFVIGFDNAVWSTFWTQAAGWNPLGWFQIHAEAVFDHTRQQLTVVSRGQDSIDLFVVGTDNAVWSTFWTQAGGWNAAGWFHVHGETVFDHTTQQVTAISRAAGSLDLFIIGNDNAVWSTFWTQAGGWNPAGWFQIHKETVFDRTTQAIAAVARTSGNLDLFVIGNDNVVWSIFWTQAGGWNPGGWFQIHKETVFDGTRQRLSVVSRAPGNLDLFLIGFDNAVWSTFWTEAGGWNRGGWFQIHKETVFDHTTQYIAAVARTSTNLDLFVIGFDNAVWSISWSEAGGWNPGGWFQLHPETVFDHTTQRVSAVSRSPGNLDLFVIGFDNVIWSLFWTQAAGWNSGGWFHPVGNTYYPMDAPAVLLPSGKVLCTASPGPPCGFPGPTEFFLYDPVSNTVAPVAAPPNATKAAFNGRLLLLPTGQVLYSANSSDVEIYTPDGAPNPAWRPVITHAPSEMVPGQTYRITGQQLNGLSQACSYGDDAQMATNYPIARMTRPGKPAVTYVRTADHSTMGVATGGANHWTNVSIPPSMATGAYQLTIVANGIPSIAVPVQVVDRTWFQLHPEAVFDRSHQEITVVARAPGNLDLFVIGFDNAVWTTFWTQAGGWNRGGWFQIHKETVFDHTTQHITAVARTSGNLDLFVIGFDNAVWSTFWTQAGGWNPAGWFELHKETVFDHTRQRIAAVARTSGNLDLFVIGFDNAVWSTFWTQAGGWNPGGWFQLHKEIVFDHTTQHIAAVARTSGNLDLFVIGFDNAVWSTFWTQGGGWNPGGWFQLHKETAFDHTRQRLAVVSRTSGNLDLFVIGFDNAVWSTFWTQAGGWNPAGWFQIRKETVFDHTSQHVVAISRAPGNLDLFVIGFDNAVWSTFWTQAAGWSQGWLRIHPDTVFDHTAQTIAVGARTQQNLDLFVIGFDNAVWSTFWTQAGGWDH